MGVARTKLNGLIFYQPSICCNGYTLFAPMDGRKVYLIDMQGNTVRQWRIPCSLGGTCELLPNSNLLCPGKVGDSPVAHLEGTTGHIFEMDRDNNIVWEYKEPHLHHNIRRLENGNTLVLKYIHVPPDVASRVKGGVGETADPMWADAIQEIDTSGKAVWEWVAYEHLDPEKDTICPICRKSEWTHATSVDVVDDDKLLVTFMRIHMVMMISRKTGEVTWRWGQGELAHPNEARMLHNGNVLVLDNGRHAPGIGLGFSRLIEVNPGNGAMVWSFQERIPFDFYTCFMGSVQRLRNENCLVCEAVTGRIFEITPHGDLAWEFVNPHRHKGTPEWGKHNFVYGARRYDHQDASVADEALIKAMETMKTQYRNDTSKVAQKVAATASSEEDKVRSRLADLGY